MPASTMYSILLRKEVAHTDAIYCGAWVQTNGSGDVKDTSNNFIVTGGLDGLVKVWLLQNNKMDLVHTLEGHSMAVVSLAVSPDGHTIASTSLDSSLIIWDLSSGSKVHEIDTSAVDVWKVAFSPDGLYVATGGHTGKVTLYDVEKGSVEKILDTRGKFALSVAWSPDGKYMCTGAVDGTVCIFDVVQGKLLHTVNAHTQPVRSLAFSPNSKVFITASNDGTVAVYDVASAGVQSKMEHKCWVLGTCVSPDGSRVAVAAADGTVRVALLPDLTVLHTFKEHTDMVCGVQFNSASNQLLSVSKDKSMIIYECPVPPKTNAKK